MDRPNTSKGFATATEVNCNSVLCKIRVGTRWPLIGCRGKAIVQYRVNFTRGKEKLILERELMEHIVMAAR